MSKKSNVNPDHYKTAGRTRQGEHIVQEIQTQKYAQSRQDAAEHDPAIVSKAATKGKATRTIGKALRNQSARNSAKRP